MKVSGSLGDEGTVIGRATLGGPKPLKALLYDGRVLTVIVGVHLHVRGGYVSLVAVVVYAVIVRLLPVVRTLSARVVLGTAVGGRVPHEAMLKRLVALLVPLEVPYHLLFLDKHAPSAAVQTVEVLPTAQILAVSVTALLAAAISTNVPRVVYQGLLLLLTSRRRGGRGRCLRATASRGRRARTH